MTRMSQLTIDTLNHLRAAKALEVLTLEALYSLPIFVVAESKHAEFVPAGAEGRLEWEIKRSDGSSSFFGWDVSAEIAYIRYEGNFHRITVSELHKAITRQCSAAV